MYCIIGVCKSQWLSYKLSTEGIPLNIFCTYLLRSNTLNPLQLCFHSLLENIIVNESSSRNVYGNNFKPILKSIQRMQIFHLRNTSICTRNFDLRLYSSKQGTKVILSDLCVQTPHVSTYPHPTSLICSANGASFNTLFVHFSHSISTPFALISA